MEVKSGLFYHTLKSMQAGSSERPACGHLCQQHLVVIYVKFRAVAFAPFGLFFSLADLALQRANQTNSFIMTNKSKQKSAADEVLIELCANKAAEKLKTKMKSVFDQALEDIRKSCEKEMAALRAQIVEMRQSQCFVFARYDDIKNEYKSLKK